MNHRWAKTRRSRWYAWGNTPGYITPILQHSTCIQCGATKWIARRAPFKHELYLQPMGNVTQRVRRMPACEGLPATYDMPVGA